MVKVQSFYLLRWIRTQIYQHFEYIMGMSLVWYSYDKLEDDKKLDAEERASMKGYADEEFVKKEREKRAEPG